MADGKHGKQFLVLLSISPCTPDRLQTLVPALKEVLGRISTEPIEQLFRSTGADHFGYLVRSNLVPPQIRAILEAPKKNPWQSDYLPIEPFLTNQDDLIIIELGLTADCSRGFSRALTWLQRH